jgi:hypothetical protein
MKYRKKPVVIEAFIWTGNMHSTLCIPDIAYKFHDGTINDNENGTLTIKTLEGDMLASAGDYIIRGINGELYPCKPDIFNKSYEPVL